MSQYVRTPLHRDLSAQPAAHGARGTRLRSAVALPLVVLAAACSGHADRLPPPTTAHQPSARASASPRRVQPRAPQSNTASGTCRSQAFSAGRLSVSQRWATGDQKCIVMVSDQGSRGKARSFLFNSHGMLMAFAVFGKGPVSRMTGARTHFLLPNVQPLRVERRRRRVLVHTTSGHTVAFDTTTGRPEGITEGIFRVSRRVKPAGGGGVTLRVRSGILVDFGFMRGGSPHQEPNRRATLTDGEGHTCTVRNRALLAYDREEPYLRYSSARQLSQFLSRRRSGAAGCVDLSVTRG